MQIGERGDGDGTAGWEEEWELGWGVGERVGWRSGQTSRVMDGQEQLCRATIVREGTQAVALLYR